MQFIYNIFISAVAAATKWSVSAAAALHGHFWSDCFQWKSWWQTYQDEVLQPVFVALMQQYSTLRLFQGDNATMPTPTLLEQRRPFWIRSTSGHFLSQHLVLICLLLNKPGTCWVNVFIRDSHSHWPLHSCRKGEQFLNNRSGHVFVPRTDGRQFASPPKEAVPHIKYLVCIL